MLGIKTGEGRWCSWWLGSPIPLAAEERVVTFQADGDELYLILQAMQATREPLRGTRIIYTKMGGFQIEKERP